MSVNMNNETIVTRFPPSPTGHLHLGGARTALFNWLYARHTGGKFVLRFEDTDRVRSTEESVDAIFEALQWLGIDWDDGPYFQTQRYDLYQEYIDRLIDCGKAYYCTCSTQRLKEVRENAMAQGGKPKYDGACRDLNRPYSEDAVVRFKAPQAGNTLLRDVIKGNITFPNSELDDFIIRRSDGHPTYNFVVVIDDITMGINTIIRGDDHVNNTPKQIQLYQALDVQLPVFGHVPMVLGPDKSRLSKRHGALSVLAYRDMGYLPEAMINYLVRLGWSFGDEEFFTCTDLFEKFSLENIGKSAGVFNPEKLLALNGEHIRQTALPELVQKAQPYFEKAELDISTGPDLDKVVATVNTRSKTMLELVENARFYFDDQFEYDQKGAKKFFNLAALDPMRQLRAALTDCDEPWNEKELEAPFIAVMEATGLKLGKIAQPLRLALTGRTVSPGIFEIIAVMGKTETLKRIDRAIATIEAAGVDEPV